MAANGPLDLGAALRSLRRQRDLSQRELAGRAGLPVSTLARIESGEITDPKLRTVERLARAAGAELAIRMPEGHVTTSSPQEPQEPQERLTDAAGRHYPAHLDVRVTYPFFDRDGRVRAPGAPAYAYQIDRAVRDGRREREAAVAALPIQRLEHEPGRAWQWVARAPDGAVAGRLGAVVLPRGVELGASAPVAVLCGLAVAPHWQRLGIEERLLAQLRQELVRCGIRVEVVTLAYRGPEAEYLRQLGFHHPVATLSMLKVGLG
jgi:transcriptional regulator with XRE-family HTH domain